MPNNKAERTVINLNKLGFNRFLQFGHYKYTEAKPKLENHIHEDSIELCFFLKGQQFYRIKNELFQLKGNDIIIISPNTQHSTGTYPEDKGELFWLQVSLNEQEGLLCNLPSHQTNSLLNQLTKNSDIIFKGAHSLKTSLEELMNELQNPTSSLTALKINHLLIHVLLETLNLAQTPTQETSSERLEIINQYIMDNLHRIIYVDELASLIHVSTGYFKPWFRKNTGITPKEYINRIKIEKAKILLSQKKSVTQVAFDLGYNSSQYFATSFKKFTGITPKSFLLSHKLFPKRNS
ncbi:helix-turn-helix transcriptional regulator [Aquimarina sp. TRL1]|uniref:AraC family transcriptional regulator n=1 Tax=Aquimarina sp. (strain TRL1) TaxID=2736252 RepID=UPI00158B7B67|nr:AraC family transcriptional regulator [Aquimarina sp. TRL1]QKX05676.1 helix-turn-helix transcriptional regulator [Aquimarina sp. TRL1]